MSDRLTGVYWRFLLTVLLLLLYSCLLYVGDATNPTGGGRVVGWLSPNGRGLGCMTGGCSESTLLFSLFGILCLITPTDAYCYFCRALRWRYRPHCCFWRPQRSMFCRRGTFYNRQLFDLQYVSVSLYATSLYNSQLPRVDSTINSIHHLHECWACVGHLQVGCRHFPPVLLPTDRECCRGRLVRQKYCAETEIYNTTMIRRRYDTVVQQ